MRVSSLVLVVVGLLCSTPAWAQLEPGSEGAPSDGPVAVSPLDEIPSVLGFNVLRRTRGRNRRGERLIHYHTDAPFPASAHRLRDKEAAGHSFGGGHRLIGWAEQLQDGKWNFVVLTPRGGHHLLRLERDAGGKTKLTLNRSSNFRPARRARRRYMENDPGPRP